MLVIYGSKMCPACVACKANFDAYGVAYTFLDINESLKVLSDFLILRDSLSVFDHCREIHDIGLPALKKEDGTVFLDWEGYLRELGHEPFEVSAEGTHCSLDRKGC